MKSFRLVILTFTLLSSATMLLACAWDYDTIAMERQRFPDALELITGKFLRHSKEFYAWRIKDRLEKLKVEKKAEWMDDLGVAYDKTGQHDLAIDTMLEKELLYPGLYETQANLGTFYIHGGKLQQGLLHLEDAIKINPHAHFDREVYQIQLVKYVLDKQVEGKQVLPLCSESTAMGYGKHFGFGNFLTEADIISRDPEQKKKDLEQAIKGVLGMLRFGNHESPILLEVLADLMLLNSANVDGKRLASRAYLQASYLVDDELAKQAYLAKVKEALKMQTIHPYSTATVKIEELEKVFQVELAQAKAWFSEVENDEKEWIAQGLDADGMFSKKYYAEPKVATQPSGYILSLYRFMPFIIISAIVIPGYLLIKFVLWLLRMAKEAR